MNRLTSEKQYLHRILEEHFDLNQEFTDEEVMEYIETSIMERSREVLFTYEEKKQLKKELYNAFRRLDVLSDLLEDENISEIMINGPQNIFIEKKGKILELHKSFSSEERLRTVIQQIVSSCNRIVNETVPIVDARLSDGSRVNVVLPPVALDGAVMTIRKFPKEFFTMDKLIQMGTVTKEVAEFLQLLVTAKYNLFISGGTGCGKTTFLNVLSNFIPGDERVITIEDSAELQLHSIPNLVRLETRNANVEGENAIPMSALIKSALRMRPDRIIVGEVRDSAAMDMVNSMLTGHDGSISTGHGNSASEILLRLETMILMGYDMPILAIRQQIAAAIDVIIHIGRLRDNSRRVLEIVEILGVEKGEIITRPLYIFEEHGEEKGMVQGTLKKINPLLNRKKLQQKGLEEV